MSNLIAHLVRRVLTPSAIRPRAPSRFEPPGAAAAPAEFVQQPRWMQAGEVRGLTAAPAEPAPVATPAPIVEVTAEARPRSRDAQPVARIPGHPEPDRKPPRQASRESPREVGVPVRVTAPDQPALRGNAVSTAQLPAPPREAAQSPHRAPDQPTTVVKEREWHTRVRETLNIRSERLVTPPPPAVAPPARTTVATAFSARTTVESQAAAAAVEIHIGRIDVRPLSPPTTPPEHASPNVPRARPQSLEDYLSARSRERRGEG